MSASPAPAVSASARFGSGFASLLRRRPVQAAVLCLAAFALAAAVALNVFEGMPHLEDEHANFFQARVFAGGEAAVAAPPSKDAFFIPFTIVRNGLWFGKYTPGYPLVLALGVLLGAPWLVNALASALTLLGVFLLGRDLFDADAGLLAAALGAVSPAFILLSGSLLAHPVAMAAMVFFAWAFLRLPPRSDIAGLGFSRQCRSRSGDASRPNPRHPGVSLAGAPRPLPNRGRASLYALLAGFALGLAVLTRPWTAFAVALPFIGIALADIARALFTRGPARNLDGQNTGRSVPRSCIINYLILTFACLAICALLPLYNYAVTGSPFTNTYTLWWPYDTIGFGPDVGRMKGHTLPLALLNAGLDLAAFQTALTGWPAPLGLPLILLPLVCGLILAPRSRHDFLLLLPPLLLIAAHLAYWARAGEYYGGRYYSEGMPFLWLLAARGLLKATTGKARLRVVQAALPLLLIWNIAFQIQPRFMRGHGLYRITGTDPAQVAAADLHNALVFVHIRYWTDYAVFSWLNDPGLDGDVIFARDMGADRNAQLIQAFPGREVFYFDRYRAGDPLTAYEEP